MSISRRQEELGFCPSDTAQSPTQGWKVLSTVNFPHWHTPWESVSPHANGSSCRLTPELAGLIHEGCRRRSFFLGWSSNTENTDSHVTLCIGLPLSRVSTGSRAQKSSLQPNVGGRRPLWSLQVDANSLLPYWWGPMHMPQVSCNQHTKHGITKKENDATFKALLWSVLSLLFNLVDLSLS